MAPPQKASAAAASASAPFAGEMDDADDSLHWLPTPTSTSSTSPSTTLILSDDPTLPPLLAQLSALDAQLTCPICHATPIHIPATLRNCAHTFCSLCLAQNLRFQALARNGTTTHTSCPTCRRKCEERDVVRNAALEEVCRIWGHVRGQVRDRMWGSSLSSSPRSGESSGSSEATATGAKEDGSKKRAAASVTASSSSSSAAAAGGTKRPRRSSSRHAGAATAAAAAAAAAASGDNANTNTSTNTDDELPSSNDDDDSGEEYDAEEDQDEGSDSDADRAELVPKSGGGCGGNGKGKGKGRAAAKAKGDQSALLPAAKSKSYPTDAEYLAAHRSTIDPRTLDRARPLAGNVHLLKRPQLIKLLGDYHLSTSTKGGIGGGGNGNGSLDVLKDRYRAFRMRYNAQCLSSRPAPIAQLVEQVHAEERARARERAAAWRNGGGRVAEEMRRLNAKWNEEKVDGGGGGGDGDGDASGGRTRGATSSRAADIPDKMKTGFAALLAEGRRRCKEQGWRMGEVEEEDAGATGGSGSRSKKKRKWEEDEQAFGAQEEEEEEKKDDGAAAAADGAEEPIVLDDDGSDEDEDDDRKPSAAEAARAAEDGINEPQDSKNDARNGDDDDREVQISRSPSSESPRTVRASSSSDGLAGSGSAASASAPAKRSSSTAKKRKPSPRQSRQHTPQPQQYQPASVDTRSIRSNNNTPSTIGPWSCGACTFYNEINIGSRDKCEVCETPRPRPSSRPSRNVASFDC